MSYNDDYEENEQEDIEDNSDDDEETKALKEMRRKRKRLTAEAGTTEYGEEGEEDESKPAKKKTKQEVMKEVIAKSKFYKHERQLQKQKLDDEIDVLDEQDNFDELLGELRNAGSFKKDVPEVSDFNNNLDDDSEKKERNKDEDYEQQVKSLAFERRGVAADRTKTEDEIALEKAEKLKKLEAQRLARMNGEEIDEEMEVSESESDADGDDINDAKEFGFNSNLDEEEKEEGSESDKNEEDDDDNNSLDGNLEIDDEFQQIDSDEEQEEKVKIKKADAGSKKGESKDGIAYTFDMPESVADLLDIFGQYPAQQQPVIVDRILTLYHPRLDPENKEKISSFTNILAEYIIISPELEPETEEEDVAPVLDKLIAILKKLADKHNESLAEFFREQLNKAEIRLQAAISKNSNEAVTETPSHLFLFTLIAVVFSTSDHFHQIVTPASLLIGLQLSQVKLNQPADILAGLYIASTALTYQRIAKRYIPEISIFLSRALYLLSPTELKGKNIPNDIFLGVMSPQKRFAAEPGLTHKKVSSDYNGPLPLRLLHTINSTPKAERKKVYTRLYVKTMQVLEAFMSLWTDDSAFIEMFSPFVGMVKGYPPTLEKLEKRLKFSQNARVPLTLQSHKPIPLATKIPKFEENYSVDKKSYDPDMARRDHKKLTTLIKKERKGALRELRKDSQFLNREKLREQKQQDKAYHEKLGRLIRTVATEEGAEKNKYERERRIRKKKH